VERAGLEKKRCDYPLSREWSEKYPVNQFCGQKFLVDGRGQRRMTRLVQADKKVTVTQ